MMNSHLPQQRWQLSQLKQLHCLSGQRCRQASQTGRLRATAIEVPEPEVVQPAATGAPTEATPEVSREILALLLMGFLVSRNASQGRRLKMFLLEITWLKKLRQG